MIRRRIRVHAKPYFPAFTYIYNRIMMINYARSDDSLNPPNNRPGEIIRIWDDRRIAVACGAGSIVTQGYEVFPALTDEDWLLHFKLGTQLT